MQPQLMPPVNHEEIVEIVGQVDDATAMAIIKTGASAEQLLEAFEICSVDQKASRELGHPSSTLITELCAILSPDYGEEEE